MTQVFKKEVKLQNFISGEDPFKTTPLHSTL